MQVSGKTFLHIFQNLEAFERLVRLPLNVHEGRSEFVDHFRASLVELILTPAEFLELCLLALELFGLPFEGLETVLRLRYLVIQLFDR